jgi:hypothetical protein
MTNQGPTRLLMSFLRDSDKAVVAFHFLLPMTDAPRSFTLPAWLAEVWSADAVAKNSFTHELTRLQDHFGESYEVIHSRHRIKIGRETSIYVRLASENGNGNLRLCDCHINRSVVALSDRQEYGMKFAELARSFKLNCSIMLPFLYDTYEPPSVLEIPLIHTDDGFDVQLIDIRRAKGGTAFATGTALADFRSDDGADPSGFVWSGEWL